MTKHRSRIRYEGVWYKPVPWLTEGECRGCAMEKLPAEKSCYNNASSENEPCSENGEFNGLVFIRCGKEGLAQYISAKLENP